MSRRKNVKNRISLAKKSIALLSIIAFTLVSEGCFSLRTEYPPVTWLSLEQKPLTLNIPHPLPFTLLFRPLTSSAELETDFLLTTDAKGELAKHRYYRWTALPSELVYDNMINRMIRYGALNGGVTEVGSAIAAEYILEVRLLSCEIGESNMPQQGKLRRTIKVSCAATLLRTMHPPGRSPVVFQRVYNDAIERENTKLQAVGGILSESLATLTDAVFADILADIQKDVR
jgi:ABC-type uncharacterized transport system auxiliary subunit